MIPAVQPSSWSSLNKMKKPKDKILLIDDDVSLCTVISHQLEGMGYEVAVANHGKDGISAFQESRFNLLLIDLQMPDMSGMHVLSKVRTLDNEVAIIIITAYGTVENAVEACRLGADDYLTKPFAKEQLRFAVEKALRFKTMEQENLRLRQEVTEKYQFEGIVSRSKVMRDLLELAKRAANSDTTILILGESGTGKELLAKAIHHNSPRRDGPFVAVNCPSIPDNLIESELFGHEKGAFTGAIRTKIGKFELAQDGTNFLDEVADLKLELQAKLLRVPQEHEIERVGGTRPLAMNVRVVAATNRDLATAVQLNKFRQDLFYRLNVIPLRLPPLRERKEDIPLLAQHFIDKYSANRKLVIRPDFLHTLMNHAWPGNVRELENIIERAVVLCPHDEIDSSCLEALGPLSLEFSISSQPTSLEEIERQAIVSALTENDWNQTRAALQLDIPRHVLIYRMKKFGIHRKL